MTHVFTLAPTQPLGAEPAALDPSVERQHATLLLVRHGESLANLERRFTRSDDEPLTPTGV
jgi:hypothetical protein